MTIEKFTERTKTKQEAILAAGIEEFSQKSYLDASTDSIVQRCGISKGLLFHYFGSKRNFYCSCLSQALDKLIVPTSKQGDNFYDILFATMEQKLKVCADYPLETSFVNLASRETAHEVADGKAGIFMRYAAQVHKESDATMACAVATLPIQEENKKMVKDGLLIYCNALLNKYLLTYQNTPDKFFARSQQIKEELKEYIDLMLYGIMKHH